MDNKKVILKNVDIIIDNKKINTIKEITDKLSFVTYSPDFSNNELKVMFHYPIKVNKIKFIDIPETSSIDLNLKTYLTDGSFIELENLEINQINDTILISSFKFVHTIEFKVNMNNNFSSSKIEYFELEKKIYNFPLVEPEEIALYVNKHDPMFETDINLNGARIINCGIPENINDVVTLSYLNKIIEKPFVFYENQEYEMSFPTPELLNVNISPDNTIGKVFNDGNNSPAYFYWDAINGFPIKFSLILSFLGDDLTNFKIIFQYNKKKTYFYMDFKNEALFLNSDKLYYLGDLKNLKEDLKKNELISFNFNVHKNRLWLNIKELNKDQKEIFLFKGDLPKLDNFDSVILEFIPNNSTNIVLKGFIISDSMFYGYSIDNLRFLSSFE